MQYRWKIFRLPLLKNMVIFGMAGLSNNDAGEAPIAENHAAVAETVVEKVIHNEQMHKQIQDVKKKSRETSQKTRLRIPKLKECKYHVGDQWPRKVKPKETMIFLTEGASAAGSLEKKRDVDCQAIFALRGKPKNASKSRRSPLLRSRNTAFPPTHLPY